VDSAIVAFSLFVVGSAVVAFSLFVVGLLVELEGDLVVVLFVSDGTGTELDDDATDVGLGFNVVDWPRAV